MNDHYFSPTPTAASDPHDVTLTLPDLTLTLATDRGVFARDDIDAGTQVLLDESPTPARPPSTILDLGCGYGPIACTVARRHPQATVWAVDTNTRALELCRTNVERHHLVNVRVSDPDGVPADVRFDLIWSNPPIRIGKAALHDLLLRWFARLAPGGEAVLVVQKHLGSDSLQRWLTEQGWPTERLVSRQSYRLLHTTNADRTSS